jgi:hypothetical protein
VCAPVFTSTINLFSPINTSSTPQPHKHIHHQETRCQNELANKT